jgi:hypothetical protein
MKWLFLNTASKSHVSMCTNVSTKKIPSQGRIVFQKMVLIRGNWCSEFCRSATHPAELGALDDSRAKDIHDAVLRTEDGRAFPVHRTVLLMHSDFFRFVCLQRQFINLGLSDIAGLRNVANTVGT